MGLEPAGNLTVALCVQGLQKMAISSSQDLRLGCRAWNILGARGCVVCVSPADHLIWLGPSHQGTVPFTALARSITYSHSLKIIAAHYHFQSELSWWVSREA